MKSDKMKKGVQCAPQRSLLHALGMKNYQCGKNRRSDGRRKSRCIPCNSCM